MLRMIVQPPVHLLGLERCMESLQQAQLLRRAVLNPHVAELLGDERHEPPRDERRSVVGHQERPLRQRSVNPFRFLARSFKAWAVSTAL